MYGKTCNDNWGGLIMVLFLTIAAFAVGFFIGYMETGKAKAVIPVERQMSEEEKVETNRLFKKHGVWWAIEDREGKPWFQRNGKWCKLR